MFVHIFLSYIQDDQKKIKTESGVWIPASYKSDRYKKWKQRSRIAQMEQHENIDTGTEDHNREKGECKYRDY